MADLDSKGAIRTRLGIFGTDMSTDMRGQASVFQPAWGQRLQNQHIKASKLTFTAKELSGRGLAVLATSLALLVLGDRGSGIPPWLPLGLRADPPWLPCGLRADPA